MHVCAIPSARATIGGPGLESRTPCSNASFHRTTTLPPGGAPRALDASLGNASDAAPAPAATRKRRRESGCSRTRTSDEIALVGGPREDDAVVTPSSRNAVMWPRASLVLARLDDEVVAAGGVVEVDHAGNLEHRALAPLVPEGTVGWVRADDADHRHRCRQRPERRRQRDAQLHLAAAEVRRKDDVALGEVDDPAAV